MKARDTYLCGKAVHLAETCEYRNKVREIRSWCRKHCQNSCGEFHMLRACSRNSEQVSKPWFGTAALFKFEAFGRQRVNLRPVIISSKKASSDFSEWTLKLLRNTLQSVEESFFILMFLL